LARPAFPTRRSSDLMPQARVLACAVRLIDRGYFRIGSEAYAEEHGTVGVATLHKEHARVDGGTVVFDYPAKGGKRVVQQVADPEDRKSTRLNSSHEW